MTADDHLELEYLRIEVHQLKAQLQSLRSALVVNAKLTADLRVLMGEPDSEQRSHALLRIGEATDEINRLLSGPAFAGQEPTEGGGG